jgi:hypothetical protein
MICAGVLSMKRTFRAAAIILPCLLISAILTHAAIAQSNSMANGSGAGNQPTALSVVALAQGLIENTTTETSRAREEVRNEAIRLPLRHRLALSMNKIGHESIFGDYVATALAAWEFWDPQRESPQRQALRRAEEIATKAKATFLAGDPEGARLVLLERDCSKIALSGYCRPDIDADSLFLTWELETGDLSAAVRRLRETNWKFSSMQIRYTERVVRALVAAGMHDEGFQILSELRTRLDLDEVAVSQTYWRLGAVEEGKSLMRRAARSALFEATRDPRKELPISIAGMQLAMGDKEGGVDTLRQILQFGPDRLGVVRGLLAGRLALANLDSNAFSLLDTTLADRGVLANIVIGQARRLDFDAAFKTLDQLRRLPAATREDSFRNSGLQRAVDAIARNAARVGDVEVYVRADAIRRQLDPGVFICTAQVLQENSDTVSLGSLARAGKAKFAIGYALALPDLSKRVEGLAVISEALAGLPDPSEDPLGFFD